MKINFAYNNALSIVESIETDAVAAQASVDYIVGPEYVLSTTI